MTGARSSDAAGPTRSSATGPWPRTQPVRSAGDEAMPGGGPVSGDGDIVPGDAVSAGLSDPVAETRTVPADADTGRTTVGTGSEPTDAALLRAHVDGDPTAFATLFHRHRDRLWAVALRTLGDREDAADALQDALLAAHRAAARFRGEAAVTTWLHRIVVNACLDRIRRRQSHPTVPLPDSPRPDRSGHRVGGSEPAAPTVDHDTALVVRQALAALPVEQRTALVLVDLQGYPVAEVAEILGVAEGTVKSRCARGRARLAVLLGHLRAPVPGTGSTGDAAPVPGDSGVSPGGDPEAGAPSVTRGNRGSGCDVRPTSRSEPGRTARSGAEQRWAGPDQRPPPGQEQEES
jgi:RNA polymerase sigma factor, sigma-70 family